MTINIKKIKVISGHANSAKSPRYQKQSSAYAVNVSSFKKGTPSNTIDQLNTNPWERERALFPIQLRINLPWTTTKKPNL